MRNEKGLQSDQIDIENDTWGLSGIFDGIFGRTINICEGTMGIIRTVMTLVEIFTRKTRTN